MKDIKNICVVGAGEKGMQIALNSAIHGMNVTLTSGHGESLEQADDSEAKMDFFESWTMF